jgi:kynurenine 3-monooxygenase
MKVDTGIILVLFWVVKTAFAFSPVVVGDARYRLSPRQSESCLSASSSPKEGDDDVPALLNVAVVGAGPSGALLSNLLLQQENIKVTLLEGRSDPRNEQVEERAYALGIGIRGRTAIRQVDEELWQAVKNRGYESERFQLHIGGLVIPLRSEKDGGDGIEPSLLMFQSQLCAALLDELERRNSGGGSGNNNLQILFDARVATCNVEDMCISTEDSRKLGPFDLIVGCDGVNSAVRSTMEEAFPAFETTKERLPGEFKVVQMEDVPPKVDPTSVSLILPKTGSCSAFVEPTDAGGGCCILFAGRGGEENPIISETTNTTAVVEALQEAFPQWEGFHETISEHLTAQTVPGSASSVVCNTYHFDGKLALVGDAAHATGGVSGQGVNSALADAVVLAECIQQHRRRDCSLLDQALLAYSKRQVPEGKALFDLSFGPKPKGFDGIKFAFQNARDTLFRGRFGIGQPPLQTRLTTNLMPFSEIRKEKDNFYDRPFPSQSEFDARLEKLHSSISTSRSSTQSEVSQ